MDIAIYKENTLTVRLSRRKLAGSNVYRVVPRDPACFASYTSDSSEVFHGHDYPAFSKAFRGLALRRLTIQNMRIVEFEKWRSFGLLFLERIDEEGAVCKKQIYK